MLLLSARLSPLAIHHLLIQASAKAIIVSPRLLNTAREALSLFAPSDLAPTVYSQTFYAAFCGAPPDIYDDDICGENHYAGEADRNVLILHSSGTTGLPKAIYHSHRYLLAYTACHDFSNNREAQALNLTTLPLYHVSFSRERSNHRADFKTSGIWTRRSMPLIGCG